MIEKTESEKVFEEFCDLNKIQWEKIKEGENTSPDYKAIFNGDIVYVEVKQIDKDDKFSVHSNSRIVGSHIREKIKEARKQVQVGSNQGAASILLIYNNLDGLQMFGTQQHDFITAMYGEITLTFDKKENRFTDSYYGRNHSFSDEKSTYFSAVGFLYRTKESVGIRLYENVFAKNKLDFSKIPDCIEVIKIALE